MLLFAGLMALPAVLVLQLAALVAFSPIAVITAAEQVLVAKPARLMIRIRCGSGRTTSSIHEVAIPNVRDSVQKPIQRQAECR